MLTERDKEILIWIENYKAISVPQCTELIFNGNYEGCRRRLKQLESRELVKSYISPLTKEKIYYQEKKLRDHDLLVLDFFKNISKNGGTILNKEIQPSYLKGLIRADAFVSYEYKNNIYFALLEVDYTHFTSNIKLKLYEKLYNSGYIQNKYYGNFPIVIIVRPTLSDIKYSSQNFEVVYTDLKYSHLKTFLF